MRHLFLMTLLHVSKAWLRFLRWAREELIFWGVFCLVLVSYRINPLLLFITIPWAYKVSQTRGWH
jgi:hypothetical protein